MSEWSQDKASWDFQWECLKDELCASNCISVVLTEETLTAFIGNMWPPAKCKQWLYRLDFSVVMKSLLEQMLQTKAQEQYVLPLSETNHKPVVLQIIGVPPSRSQTCFRRLFHTPWISTITLWQHSVRDLPSKLQNDHKFCAILIFFLISSRSTTEKLPTNAESRFHDCNTAVLLVLCTVPGTPHNGQT